MAKALLASELRSQSLADLEAQLAELKVDRFKLRFRSATESIENPMQFRSLRRDIARLEMVLGEKRRGNIGGA